MLNEITDAIKNKSVDKLRSLMKKYELHIVNGKIVPINKENYLTEYKKYDMMQMARKILLNALYGCLTTPSSRFYDQRMGQSCTLSGRTITRHMACAGSEILGDGYRFTDDNNKHTRLIKYIDTDSNFISIEPILPKLEEIGWELNRDNFTALADSVTLEINKTFPDFLNRTYNVPHERAVISCGREICSESLLLVTKKKYACSYYDKEGIKSDNFKIMGIEVVRSDTVPFVQEKLKESIALLLKTKNVDELVQSIRAWRDEFSKIEPHLMGVPKTINNISKFTSIDTKTSNKKGKGKVTIPGHVAASIRWNNMLLENNDITSPKIMNGSKIIVCKLKGGNRIAYPIDCLQLPKWFLELNFDVEGMVQSMVDDKADNIFGCIGLNTSLLRVSDTYFDFFE